MIDDEPFRGIGGVDIYVGKEVSDVRRKDN